MITLTPVNNNIGLSIKIVDNELPEEFVQQSPIYKGEKGDTGDLQQEQVNIAVENYMENHSDILQTKTDAVDMEQRIMSIIDARTLITGDSWEDYLENLFK